MRFQHLYNRFRFQFAKIPRLIRNREPINQICQAKFIWQPSLRQRSGSEAVVECGWWLSMASDLVSERTEGGLSLGRCFTWSRRLESHGRICGTSSKNMPLLRYSRASQPLEIHHHLTWQQFFDLFTREVTGTATSQAVKSKRSLQGTYWNTFLWLFEFPDTRDWPERLCFGAPYCSTSSQFYRSSTLEWCFFVENLLIASYFNCVVKKKFGIGVVLKFCPFIGKVTRLLRYFF